jgi:hypothetical protein
MSMLFSLQASRKSGAATSPTWMSRVLRLIAEAHDGGRAPGWISNEIITGVILRPLGRTQ